MRPSVIPSIENAEMYNNHFELHSNIIGKEKKVKLHTVIQDLQTSLSLESMKKLPGFMDYLRQHKLQLNQHKWTADEWNVQSVGFLPRFSPPHHSKEMVVQSLNTRFKHIKNMPSFRIRKMIVFANLYNTPLRVQVYAIEVQAQCLSITNRLIMQQVNYPEEYIPFQMRQMNEQAYNNAVAYTAQFQSELRTIVVNNVTKEAHFVLEHQTMLLPNVLHTYHMMEKNSMRIVVTAQVFEVTRHTTQHVSSSYTR
jgi:hypothetical protein